MLKVGALGFFSLASKHLVLTPDLGWVLKLGAFGIKSGCLPWLSVNVLVFILSAFGVVVMCFGC